MPSVYRMMKMLAIFANRDAKVKSFVSGLDSRVLMEIKEEEPFYIAFSNNKLSVHKGKPEQPDAVITSEKETMMGVVSGKLTQEDAFNRKLIETSGSMQDAMRLRYVINQTLQKNRLLNFSQKLLSIFQ